MIDVLDYFPFFLCFWKAQVLNTNTMLNFKPSNSNGKGHYLKRKIQLRLAAVTRFKNGRKPIKCWICNLDQKFWDT